MIGVVSVCCFFFFFSSRRRHTRSLCDWSSDVCSSDLGATPIICVKSRPLRGMFCTTSSGILIVCVCVVVSKVRAAAETRSEERRVGKECRVQWASYYENKNSQNDNMAKRHDMIEVFDV